MFNKGGFLEVFYDQNCCWRGYLQKFRSRIKSLIEASKNCYLFSQLAECNVNIREHFFLIIGLSCYSCETIPCYIHSIYSMFVITYPLQSERGVPQTLITQYPLSQNHMQNFPDECMYTGLQNTCVDDSYLAARWEIGMYLMLEHI